MVVRLGNVKTLRRRGYKTGVITDSPRVLPSMEDMRASRVKVAMQKYLKKFRMPSRGTSVRRTPDWAKNKFQRFKTGRSLKGAKSYTFKRLGILPSENVSEEVYTPGNLRNLVQQPTIFPELAGFDEEPLSVKNVSDKSAVSRGGWGQLTNVLTKAGEWYFTIEKAKQETKLAEARAKESAMIVEKPVYTEPKRNLMKILPIILLGGVAYFVLKPKFKRR